MIIDSPIISGSYLSTGSLSQTGNVSITGSLTATAGVSGSFSGSGADLFGIPVSGITGLNLSQISSGSVSASISPNQGLLINTSVSASNFTGSFTGSLTGIATSASYASFALTSSYSLGGSGFPFSGSAVITGSLLVSGSQTLTGSLSTTGPITASSVLATGTITAQTLVVSTISSSVQYSSGSNIFGNSTANTQTFTGSVNITGSAVNLKDGIFSGSGANLFGIPATGITGLNLSQIASGSASASISPNNGLVVNTNTRISGSTQITGSLGVTGSFSVSGSTGTVFSSNADTLLISGSLLVTGSAQITGSLSVSGSITGSLFGTASFALDAATLTGTGSVGFTTTASFNAVSSSQQSISASLLQVSASYIALSASYNTFSGSTSTRITTISSSQQDISASQQQISASLLTISRSYASTGSNTFVGLETITGSLIVTGSVAVSTLVTSSGVRYVIADQNGLLSAQTASAAIFTTQQVVSTAGQTTFPITNGYATGYVTVFVNGTKLSADEYVDTSGTNIIFLTGSNSGDVVEFQKYLPAAGVSNNTLRSTNYFTATTGQTNFSVNYTPGLIDIFYNGAKLDNTEYTAANGTSITLATASAAGDRLEVDVYSYQVGAFSGIGGTGAANQLAYFNTSNSITGSNAFTVSGSAVIITGSLIVSGSGTFTNIGPAVFSGSVTAVGGFSGSFSGNADSASLAQNSLLLQGTGSIGFATTASLLAVSSSQQQISASLLNVVANYATTGSNSFRANQSITGSLVVSSTITAQTLVVQTVTSSIVYSSGSNLFGSQLGDRQTFTGSVNITGSITQIGTNTTSSFGGSVGIGTISPQAKMHILNSTVGGSYFGQLIVEENGEAALQLKGTNYSSIYFSDASSPYQAGIIYRHSNDTIEFRASGNTTAMVITSGSNVGIGTITPTSSFNVVKSDNTTAAISSFTANNLSQQTDIWYGGIRMGGTNANVDLNLASKGAGIISISGSTTFTSNSTNPINYYATDASGEGLKIQWQTAYGPNRIVADIRGNASGAGGAFIIRVADTSAVLRDRLTISNTGDITIGNATYNPTLIFNSGGATSYYGIIRTDNDVDFLQLSGGSAVAYNNAANATFTGASRYGTYTAGMLNINAGNASNNTTYGYIQFSTANTLRMQISWNGAIGTTAGGTNIYNPSDLRLKKNITGLTYGLNEILALKPSKFNWKDGFSESEADKDILGFIAQDVQSVIPEAVESFGQNVTVKTGDHDYSVENPLRVNEKFIIPVLVKAIQELQEKLQRNNIN